jgi:hypothetical protein
MTEANAYKINAIAKNTLNPQAILAKFKKLAFPVIIPRSHRLDHQKMEMPSVLYHICRHKY